MDGNVYFFYDVLHGILMINMIAAHFVAIFQNILYAGVYYCLRYIETLDIFYKSSLCYCV